MYGDAGYFACFVIHAIGDAVFCVFEVPFGVVSEVELQEIALFVVIELEFHFRFSTKYAVMMKPLPFKR